MLFALIAGHLGLLGMQSAAIDSKLAFRYFQEAKWISEDDKGALWGRPLYGPMVFVDPKSREATTNERPPDATFLEEDGVFQGKLDSQYPVANTSFVWKGEKWTMVMWPPPVDRVDRSLLLMHELYHRIQDDLGWPGGSPQNMQMDTLEGRLWLQLELRSLAEALAAEDDRARLAAEGDALAFRAMRYRKFGTAKAEEDSLELNEGLAEFTGYMLRGGSEEESRMWLASQLRGAIGLPSYARRFPYLTGAAYAMLLNVREGAKWRLRLKPEFSLAGELQTDLGLRLDQPDSKIIDRAKKYGYAAIRSAELKRDVEHKKRVAEIRKRLIDGPVLVTPPGSMRISFSPMDVVPLGDEGTYYPAATVTDEWGKLDVTGGVIVSSDWRTVRVVAPLPGASAGEGWTLTLNPGWKIVPGTRHGDFSLSKG